MDPSTQLDRLLEIAAELGAVVRYEAIDGQGGGLCRIKGANVVFVDTLADLDTRLERTLEAVARLPGIDEHYLLPELREPIDRIRQELPTADENIRPRPR